MFPCTSMSTRKELVSLYICPVCPVYTVGHSHRRYSLVNRWFRPSAGVGLRKEEKDLVNCQLEVDRLRGQGEQRDRLRTGSQNWGVRWVSSTLHAAH